MCETEVWDAHLQMRSTLSLPHDQRGTRPCKTVQEQVSEPEAMLMVSCKLNMHEEIVSAGRNRLNLGSCCARPPHWKRGAPMLNPARA